MTLLAEVAAQLGVMPEADRRALAQVTIEATKDRRFIPSPGPQTEAYTSAADLLLYGGEGGGGKSALGVGLGITEHRRSLIVRRRFADLEPLIDIALSLNGSRDGFTSGGRPKLVTPDGRLVVFGANQYAGDEQGYQGNPFDFKYFDEGCQLLEQQVRFHLGWIRLGPGVDPKQRRRAIIGSNPPLDANGDWIIGMFRPWLDLTHPNPAKQGELRWFITDEKGEDFEVDGPAPIERGGEKYIPKSRTFIRARLSDNPFLTQDSQYRAQLDALPEPLRSAVRDGNFMAARPDADRQVIPMAWIIAAQDRWKEDGHKTFTMTAMAIDPAGGGADACEIAYRHGGWYGPLVTAKGEQTADGAAMAGLLVGYRRDSCPVVVDVGGGYGGAVMLRLKDNGIDCVRFDGGGAATGEARDGSRLKFVNKRAMAWWRFREELNPEQQGGSVIALPPDPELRSDLAAPTWELSPRGIVIEGKDDLRKRLGRSPGKGDAVVMCLSEGQSAARRAASRAGGNLPKVTIGYAGMKKRRGR